jgi:hypothetical protein
MGPRYQRISVVESAEPNCKDTKKGDLPESDRRGRKQKVKRVAALTSYVAGFAFKWFIILCRRSTQFPRLSGRKNGPPSLEGEPSSIDT